MVEDELRVVDPRGRTVICGGPDLYYLLNEKHKENAEIITRQHVIETIRNPQNGLIYLTSPDAKHGKNQHIYYKRFSEIEIEIKIVVNFNDPEMGRITTINFCSRRPDGEIIIWPQ
jgi:hypothetical protein